MAFFSASFNELGISLVIMDSELQLLLCRHLEKASKFKRPPKNLRKSFALALRHKTANQHRASIFLCTGFQAWLSYLLASNATKDKSCYQGKANDGLILSRLEKKSTVEKRDIARTLCDKTFGNHIEAKIKEWEEHCRKREYRNKFSMQPHTNIMCYCTRNDTRENGNSDRQ